MDCRAVLCAAILSLWVVLASPVARAGGEFVPSLSHDDLDLDVYTEWTGGRESAPWGHDPWGAIVTRNNGIDCERPGCFGNNDNPGIRYMRYGFKHAVTLGTVLTRGNSSLSCLKPGVAYPGNLQDESQWEPAERIGADGKITSAETTKADYACWVFPPGMMTRALRLTHHGVSADKSDPYIHGCAGIEWGMLPMEGRVANVGTQGKATASVRDDVAWKLVDGIDNGRDFYWDNSPQDSHGKWQPAPGKPSIMVCWPKPVTLCGLELEAGLVQSLAVDMYTGPAGRQPRLEDEREWKQVRVFDDCPVDYPAQMDTRVMDLGERITTSAVRLRLLEGKDTSSGKVHPHVVGRSMGGTRFEIGEIMAFMPLDSKPLSTAVIKAPRP